MYLKCVALALLGIFLLPQHVMADEAFNPLGVWIASDGEAHVQLKACGTHLCGTVVWLAEPIDPDTHVPKLDKRNSDQSLRARPIMGLKVLDMEPDEDGIWHGDIYNGQDGNTYDATLRNVDGNVGVQGCVFFGLLCKTQTWTRYVKQ